MNDDDTPDAPSGSNPGATLRMAHSDGRSCDVVASAFDGYWRLHGWTLVPPEQPPTPTPEQADAAPEQAQPAAADPWTPPGSVDAGRVT